MEKLKPWQVILFVAAAGALVFLVIWGSSGEKVRLGDSMFLVDVTTGELFEYDTSGRKGVVLPVTNPDTGKMALLPAYEDEQGQWIVSRRYFGELEYVEGETKALDRNSGVVTVTSTKAKWVSGG